MATHASRSPPRREKSYETSRAGSRRDEKRASAHRTSDNRGERRRSRSRERDDHSSRRRGYDDIGDRDDYARRRSRSPSKDRDEYRKEKKQVAELSIYSATDNPFHDVNLGQQFRWHKKNEKEKKLGLSQLEAQRRDAIRRQEAKEELERLNKRRAEREAEQRLREEEEARMQRLTESAQMSDWLAKDGQFQLQQERDRAAIRIREKRAKAIDFLALNLRYVHPIENEEEEDAGLEIDLDEPYNILDNLNPTQVEELHDDIERYLSLEESEVNIDFWTNMMVVCKDRLDKIKGITACMLLPPYEHLATLQKQIQAKLSSGEPVDTDYWEALLKKLIVWKAKAKLNSLHEVVVRNRLEQLRKRQRDEALQAQEELLAGVARSAAQSVKGGRSVAAVVGTRELDVPPENVEPYDRSMSPPLVEALKLSAEEQEFEIVTERDQLQLLLGQRRAVAASRYVSKAAQPVVATETPEVTATWEDKWRPRKPRYFNRVHTGYEWNKYNQTHYDLDNPPPKVVQGYKFNIFYPDLIDKSKAPTAGPPYEDIAFRIVNREWEFSHKRGFRSSFDRGCLSLWFNFRRNFYRK
ncbi:mid region of cactin-domain-containing protein [Pisolithus croceorrhizus]|nr:mid region of cactin-domain-containing protein [Pisolithus croceorrhizus]